ncbi:hypothetical protein NNG48_07000 [Enterococcus faecium]|nr:hypothetical protein [Enterococcus faecium]
MILKILLVVAIIIITNLIQKRRYQKKLDELQFLGMSVENKGELVEIKLKTTEGIYSVEAYKRQFIKKVEAGLSVKLKEEE